MIKNLFDILDHRSNKEKKKKSHISKKSSNQHSFSNNAKDSNVSVTVNNDSINRTFIDFLDITVKLNLSHGNSF